MFVNLTHHVSIEFNCQEFSCQEVRENFDDLVLFFSTSSEMQRFLSMLEGLWNSKMVIEFHVVYVHRP